MTTSSKLFRILWELSPSLHKFFSHSLLIWLQKKKKKRAVAISVVLSGLLFGILLALAGIIAEFTASWRVVYYFAVGVLVLVLVGSYLMLPDYPSKNKDLTHWNILWTTTKFSVTEPILLQDGVACLVVSIWTVRWYRDSESIQLVWVLPVGSY